MKRWSIVILAVCVVVAVAILAWRRYDLPWAAALAEYLLVIITAIVAIITLARRTAGPSGPIDLDEWENVLRERMRDLWVEGRGAALQEAERDSPYGLQNLSFVRVPELLHKSRRVKSAAARSFSLHDNLTPSQLFTQEHDESMLVVGAPGSGKSVLLWQILDDLLLTDGGRDVRVPVFIELHRWSTMDDVNKSEELIFQDFIAHELATPAIGLPEKVAQQLVARNRLTYLLDGLDELPGEYGARCLFALSKFARGPGERPQRRVALTCREDDYLRLKEERYPSGTDAVLHALRITPLPDQVIDKALATGPTESRLSKAAKSVPALKAMLGIPLWLSIAEEVYRRASEWEDPLKSLDGDDSDRIQSKLFAQWLDQRLDPESLERHQLEFLAWMMQENSQQTLYLEVLAPAWLGPAGWARAAERLTGLVSVVPAGLMVGAGFALIATTPFGRTAGTVFGLATGLAVGVRLWQTVRRHAREPNVVIGRQWLWRVALSRQTFRAELRGRLRQGLAFGLYLGLTLGVAFAVAVWLTVGPSVDLADLPSFGRAAGEALRELLGDQVVEMILVVSLLVSLVALGALGGIAIGLVSGVTLALVVGGWVPQPSIIGRSSRPNEALLNSTVQGLVTGLVTGLAVGLVSGVTFGLTSGLGRGVIIGLTVGSACGWAYGLTHGLAAPIAHAATRMTAVVHGVLPLKLVSFLRDASENGIIYPVGPGFRFRHRTLAEHLAATTIGTRR